MRAPDAGMPAMRTAAVGPRGVWAVLIDLDAAEAALRAYAPEVSACVVVDVDRPSAATPVAGRLCLVAAGTPRTGPATRCHAAINRHLAREGCGPADTTVLVDVDALTPVMPGAANTGAQRRALLGCLDAVPAGTGILSGYTEFRPGRRRLLADPSGADGQGDADAPGASSA